MRCSVISIIIASVLLINISLAISNDSHAQADIIRNQFTVGDTVEPYRKFDVKVKKGWRLLNEEDDYFNTQWYVVAITDSDVTLRLTSGRYRWFSGEFREVGYQSNFSSSNNYKSYFPGRPGNDQTFKSFRRVVPLVYFEDIVSEFTKLSIPTNAAEIITVKNIQFRGDIKKDLIDLCKKEDTREVYCKINDDGKMSFGNFKYGNLIANPSQASAVIGSNGELLVYDQLFERKMVSELTKILTMKYGKPFSKIYNDWSFRDYWKDMNGTVIVIKTPIDSVSENISAISIMSSSFIDKINRTIAEAVQKSTKELERKRQDGIKNL